MKSISCKAAKAAGLKRYFTGKPCPKGHVAERYVGCRKCIECHCARSTASYAKNREKVCARSAADRAKNPEKYRAYELKHRFGLTLADYDAMLEQQDGVCAICKTATTGGRGRFCVDHNHDTGVIRGLLCTNCNTMLGMAKDSPERLDAGAKYLRSARRTVAASAT